jgi:hypothetical protein
MPTKTLVDRNVARFQPIDDENVYVLGTDGKLWLETAPFGNAPPKRVEVDVNVKAWRTVFTTGALLVLHTDNTLWTYPAPDPNARYRIEPRPPVQIDGDVKDFFSWDGETIFVLGTNGNFWQESAPFGKVPPHRIPVDEGVLSFYPLLEQISQGGSNVSFLIQGTIPGNPVLIENPPYGSLPPTATLVDKFVSQFADGGTNYDGQIFLMLLTNGMLYQETGPFGTGNPRRTTVDQNVKTFRGPAPDGSLYVLTTDANNTLWLDFAPFGDTVPPARVAIDTNIATMEGLNEYEVYVLDRQGTLSLWQGPFSSRSGGFYPGNEGSGSGGYGGGPNDGGAGSSTDDGPTDDPFPVPGGSNQFGE